MNKFFNDLVVYIAYLSIMLYGVLTLPTHERGAPLTWPEWVNFFYIISHTWVYIKAFWALGGTGIKIFFREWWHIYDVLTIVVFYISFSNRLAAYVQVEENGLVYGSLLRKYWPADDPTLIGEGFFSVGVVMTFGRLLYLFQISQILGPLQIVLSKMVDDIMQILVLFFLILFSFSIGMTKLYQYYKGGKMTNAMGEEFKSNDKFAEYV